MRKKHQINCVLFIGLGGAGQRHLRVLRKILPETKFIAYRKKKKTPLLKSNFEIDHENTIENKYNIKIFNNLKNAYLQKPELTVISTPTSNHYKDCLMAIKNKSSIIVEKPCCLSTKEIDNLSKLLKNNNLSFFTSYQRRYHPIVREIRSLLKKKKIGNIISVNFNTLSDVRKWHPYENYMNLYALNKKLGGGVLNTEIHEIDLANWLFGKPLNIFYKKKKISNLEIDVEDTINVLAFYKELEVSFSISFLSNQNKRTLIIQGDEGEIFCDFNKQYLRITNLKGYVKKIKKTIDNEKLFYIQNSDFIKNFNKLDNKNLENIKYNCFYLEKSKKLNYKI